MTGLRLEERVQVSSMLDLGVPAAFHWRGRRHVVRRVDGVSRRRGRQPGRSVSLSTQEGLRCRMIQDESAGHWILVEVGGG